MAQEERASVRIFVDCFNISAGGGATHIINLLNSDAFKEKNVVVCGSSALLQKIDESRNIYKYSSKLLNRGLLARALWHLFLSKKLYRDTKCTIGFYPGGLNFSSIGPFVTMSRNMLPFDTREIFRYRSVFFRIKLLLIRIGQLNSFRRCDGLIFLNKTAKSFFSEKVPQHVVTSIIPHGVDSGVLPNIEPESRSIKNFLYVSHFSPYKNHLQLLKAFAKLIVDNDIFLTLVGSKGEALLPVRKFLVQHPSVAERVVIVEGVAHDAVCEFYKDCDVFLFPSSCENLPNIVLEVLSFRKIIISSYFGPMASMLGSNAYYFNPLDSGDIEAAINHVLIKNPKTLRRGDKNLELQRWDRTASSTIEFIEKTEASIHVNF